RLRAQGFDYLAGLEVEFHLFKLENPRLAPDDATWPPRAPEVSLLNQGYQYLTESRFDQIDAALAPIRRGIVALGMPLRSVEVELGPSQCEFTFRPQSGLDAADTMILFRAATNRSRAVTVCSRASCAARRSRTCFPAAGTCTSRCSSVKPAATR